MADFVACTVALLNASESAALHIAIQTAGVGVAHCHHFTPLVIELDAIKNTLAILVFAYFHFAHSVYPSYGFQVIHGIYSMT